MPLTKLDDGVALIVIDLQRGIVALPTAHSPDEIVRRSALLAAAFRAAGSPVVLVNVAGTAPGRTDRERPAGDRPADWADLVSELGSADSDLQITKTRWGAFHDTGLDASLHDLGVTQVAVTGIATSMGVESTARSAHELGYNVVIPLDAVTDLSADSHHHTVARIFPAIAETTTTDDLLRAITDRDVSGR